MRSLAYCWAQDQCIQNAEIAEKIRTAVEKEKFLRAMIWIVIFLIVIPWVLRNVDSLQAGWTGLNITAKSR